MMYHLFFEKSKRSWSAFEKRRLVLFFAFFALLAGAFYCFELPVKATLAPSMLEKSDILQQNTEHTQPQGVLQINWFAVTRETIRETTLSRDFLRRFLPGMTHLPEESSLLVAIFYGRFLQAELPLPIYLDTICRVSSPVRAGPFA